MGAVTSPGASGMCATHGVCGTGMSCQGFSYAYIQMMPQQYASSSYCNVIGRLPGGGLQTGGGYPNNDFALDNAIAFTLHELTEMILSSPAYNYNGAPYPNPNGGGAFQDAAGNE